MVDDIVSMLSELRGVPANCACSDFVLLVRALDAFLRRSGGAPPLPGTLPDLTASTEYFIALQEVYSRRAALDRSEFRAILEELCHSIGRTMVDDDRIEVFSKNARCLQFLSTSSLEDELQGVPSRSLAGACCDPYSDPVQVRCRQLYF